MLAEVIFDLYPQLLHLPVEDVSELWDAPAAPSPGLRASSQFTQGMTVFVANGGADLTLGNVVTGADLRVIGKVVIVAAPARCDGGWEQEGRWVGCHGSMGLREGQEFGVVFCIANKDTAKELLSVLAEQELLIHTA